MESHSTPTVFLYLALSIFLDTCYAAHTLRLVSRPPSANLSTHHEITESDASDSAFSTLGRIKLGLAAAFFFSVLLACGLPILLIDWLQKRDTSSNCSPCRFQRPSETVTIANNGALIGGESDTDSRSESSRIRTTDIWPNDVSSAPHHYRTPKQQHKNSTASEPLSTPNQSPNPADAEHTDLLTGTRVATGSGWSHVRRLHGASSVDPRLAGASSTHQLRSRRGTAGALRSSTSRKLLLRLWFSRLNCFAAGIFLSSGFMELYVDVEESIEEAKTQLHVTSEFPFAPFLTLIGFFLVLSLEQIIWSIRLAKTDSHPERRFVTSTSETQISSPCANGCAPRSDKHDEPVESPRTAMSPLNTDTHFTFTDEIVMPAVDGGTNPFNRTPVDLFGSAPPRRPSKPVLVVDNHDPLHGSNHLHSHQHNEHKHHHHHHNHHHHHLPSADSLTSFGALLQVVVLLCAMSVHSLFEGLAVGLQSNVQHTLALFSAILLHKLIIAAGIGVNLATATTSESVALTDSSTSRSPVVNRRIVAYQSLATLILAGSSPLGVLIGWALVRQEQQSGPLLMSTAILQGLACGTFFFVVFCELLPTEFREGVGDRLCKLLFLILGFIMVALYSFFMPH